MEGDKANCYAALQEGERGGGGSKFCQKVRYVTVERSLRIHWRFTFLNVKRCSTLRLWEGYLIHFKLKPVYFKWMFVSKVKELKEC